MWVLPFNNSSWILAPQGGWGVRGVAQPCSVLLLFGFGTPEMLLDMLLMATSASLLATHPVEPDECQAHGHEDEAHSAETSSLKTNQRKDVIMKSLGLL